MYQAVPTHHDTGGRKSAAGRPTPRRRYDGSAPALAVSIVLAMAFVLLTLARASGRFGHLDLRIVAHLVPLGYHHHVLRALHPLVHLGDAAFVAAVAALAALGLWARRYRRPWAVLLVALSWPIELGCKALIPQPAVLGSVQDTVTLRDLVHGPGAAGVLDWLHQATPGVGTLLRHAGSTTLSLTSSYPSGSTARGAFVLGLLIWMVLRLKIPVLSVAAALALLAPLAGLGLAMLLFAWHWPADVLGGYLLGFALLALALALLGRPIAVPPPLLFRPGVSHSRHGRLPWVIQD